MTTPAMNLDTQAESRVHRQGRAAVLVADLTPQNIDAYAQGISDEANKELYRQAEVDAGIRKP